jgi:hypothetical protein
MLTGLVCGVHATLRLGIETIRKHSSQPSLNAQAHGIHAISRLLTEFGWSLVRWEDGKEINEQGHLVVQERRRYTNTYVPNNREVINSFICSSSQIGHLMYSDQRYNFGETEFIDKKQFKERIQGLISDLTKKGPLFLVFHDNSQDIK